MRSVKVWDPVVRVFHWGTALLFLANMTLIPEESRAHLWAGYLLFGLVLVRLLWGLIGTRPARFASFWPTKAALWSHLKGLFRRGEAPHLTHNPLGALMVLNLLGSLILIALTGMLIDAGLGWMEGPHEFLANYTLICVGLHILGVLIETKRSKVNLVRAMVTGRKEFPEPATGR